MTMCPICKAEAEEIEPGTFVDGVWFRCLKHREFGVSDIELKVVEARRGKARGTGDA